MAPSELTAQRDTDWADRETRQSVSAGNIRYGQHLLRIWSYGQTAVVMSSVEAELYAIVSGCAASRGGRALGFRSWWASQRHEAASRCRCCHAQHWLTRDWEEGAVRIQATCGCKQLGLGISSSFNQCCLGTTWPTSGQRCSR